jgi:predicted esterase YcpF (UPF0227 family)
VIFYLHGFASSAQSTKARYFQERLSERGRTLVCPDFNGPDFRALTMTRMLDQLEQAIGRSPDDPVVLRLQSRRHAGDSRGGRFGPRVDRVVLIAVMFAKAITSCRRSGSTNGAENARSRFPLCVRRGA